MIPPKIILKYCAVHIGAALGVLVFGAVIWGNFHHELRAVIPIPPPFRIPAVFAVLGIPVFYLSSRCKWFLIPRLWFLSGHFLTLAPLYAAAVAAAFEAIRGYPTEMEPHGTMVFLRVVVLICVTAILIDLLVYFTRPKVQREP